MMSKELLEEVEAINSIYSPDSLVDVCSDSADNENIYTLILPTHPVTLRISFPKNYPTAPPTIPGVQSIGESKPKGYGSHTLELAREVLSKVFTPSQVCVFDLVEELEKILQAEEEQDGGGDIPDAFEKNQGSYDRADASRSPVLEADTTHTPEWIHSETISQKKSVFIAHATAITHPSQLPALMTSLHATSKNISKATHNISAYRVRSPGQTSSTTNATSRSDEAGPAGSAAQGIVYQDYDEDGETAAGGRLLHLMQIMDVWNVLVVVSRWYGGINLGPDRFRIINQVAREVLVAGGWGKKKLGKDGGG